MPRFARLLSLLALILPGLAVAGAGDVAVVLLHGKHSDAGGALAPLVKTLNQQGYQVLTPNMPWSSSRAFDASFEDGLEQVDQLVEGLREKNEDIIVFVGGHSLGANAAIAYSALYSYVDGILAIGPGHTADLDDFQARLNGSVARARAMVANGQANVAATFTGLRRGHAYETTLPASVYLSYYDPQGNAATPNTASRLWEGVSLLWVVGREDPMAARGKGYAYAKVPFYEFNRYIEVPGGHDQTPRIASGRVLSWMQGIITSLQDFTEGIEETQVAPGVNLEGMGL